MIKGFLDRILVINLILSFTILSACSDDENPNKYLEKVLNNLENINSATYYVDGAGYAPFDTVPSIVFTNYVKEYSNPTDTFVGASFVVLTGKDASKMDYCYDGNMRARVHWDEKTMEIDSFQNNILPFRMVNAPFFTRAKRLIKYFLNTEDSIRIETVDFGDSIQYSFSIYDTIVEIIGNRIIYTPALYGTHKGKVSKYDIWINKSNDLPYHIKRDMPHDISIALCRDVELNKGKLSEFIASEYFPDYPLRSEVKKVKAKVDLLGEAAPNWVLNDVENKTVALEDLKSKVLMIQFTSVSCGPCKMSIAFLKELATEYSERDFDFVAIESFNRNSSVLQNYQERNLFSYKFLMSTEEVTEKYQIRATPVFYILDENRVVRRIIRGYGKGTTDKEIRDAINELI